MSLYETELHGVYHEHWLASSFLDAARRAVSHAQELGLALDHVDVSTMVQPEDPTAGGLVYVVNNTRAFAVQQDCVKRIVPQRGRLCRRSTGRE